MPLNKTSNYFLKCQHFSGNRLKPEFGIYLDGVYSSIYTGGFYPEGIGWNEYIITDSNWHHLVLVYDGTEMRFYKDGVLVRYKPGTGTVGPQDADTKAATINQLAPSHRIFLFINYLPSVYLVSQPFYLLYIIIH